MKNITLIIILFFISLTVSAQDVLMQNGTVNQCTGTLLDSGGSTSNYSSDENFTLTLCPDGPDQFIQIAFTFFSTQQNLDVLTIYDGDDITAPVLGTFSGGGAANNPGTLSASTTSATGCITLQFTSDGSGNTIGWSADISCLQSCQTITPSIDTTVPAAVAGVIQIPVGNTVDFNGSAIFSDDGTGATYSWIPGDGSAAIAGQTATHQFNNIGTFTTTFSVTDNNPTGCTESVTITVEVLSPYIDVDQTTYTNDELITDVLIDSPCAAVSNIVSSSGNNFGSSNGIGYFSTIPGAFAFEAGIILSTGDAIAAEGPEIGNQSNGNGAWDGDADLEAELGGATDTNNASFIQFDFVPIANSISFDFIFASEEYGTFQCGFTDAFAFLLTDLTTGITTNLALVPGTTDVVSVFTVRDMMWNAGCPSVNPAFFDAYYGPGGLPAANNPTNFLGYTTSMTAFSNVIPNNNYTIKLVIADALDTAYDAAVFLEAGSFNLGGELGDDITIVAGTAQCLGTPTPLDTQLPTATHTWYLDGTVIPGETGSIYNATEPGTYSVDIVFSATCIASDSIEVEFIPGPTIQAVNTLTECDDGSGVVIFDLTENDVPAIGTQDQTTLSISYHNSDIDAMTAVNPIANPTNYNGTDGEMIYIRIEDSDSGMCIDTEMFLLEFLTITLNDAIDIEVCDDVSNDGLNTFDLTTKDIEVLGATQLPADFNVTYHNSIIDADTGANALVSPYEAFNGEIIYVRIESAIDAACYIASQNDAEGFTVTINPRALATQPMPIELCDDISGDNIEIFDLTTQEPAILNGQDPLNYSVSYYELQTDVATSTNPIVNATMYSNTSQTQTIYVRVDDNLNPTCFGETSFNITVNLLPVIIAPTPLEICDDATPDGINEFDLNIKNQEITGGVPTYLVTYYETQADAVAGLNPLAIPYTNTTANMQQIFVRVEDSTTGCYSTTTLALAVEQAPTAFVPNNLEYCDPDSDGFGEFTLTDADADITGGAAGLTVTYHETMADADNNVNMLSSPYNNIVVDMQTIYVRVESATIATDCASFVELVLIVNPTPQLTDPSALELCDNDADGFATFDLTVKNPEILNLLDADAANDLDPVQYIVTYHVLDTDAIDGINAIATPNAYVNTVNPQIVHIRVEDTANGCSSVSTLELIVNPLPVLVQPDPLALCDINNPGDEVEAFTLEDANAQILNGQTGITLSYFLTQVGADTDDAAAEIFSPYTNIPNPQTIYVRAENDVTGCVSTITLDLRVNPIPSPVAMPVQLAECDDDNDGFGLFDLDSQSAMIINGEPDISITYYETQADAMSMTNPLVSPYANIVEDLQTIYVLATNDITGCTTIVELPLVVEPSPIVPTAIEDYIVCDDDDNGFNQFDFNTVITPQILTGGQTAVDYALSYHTTLADADSGNNPIVNTANYTNVSNPQVIYIRLESNSNGCVTTGAFNISVSLPPEIDPTYDNELSQCDDLDANYMQANDGFTTFDLTVEDAEIVNGNNSWIVTYYETQADAQADVNAIADPTTYTNTMNGPQTVFIRVTDNDTGCFSFTTVTIRVLPNPSPSPNPDDLIVCDDTNAGDMIELFDLTQNEVFIINGELGVTASYYTSQQDAIMGNNAIVDPVNYTNEDPTNPGIGITPQTIYVRLTNGDDPTGLNGTGCYSLVSFDVIVNPLPVVTPVDDYIICELFNDGIADFDLESMTPAILAGQDASVFTVTYHETVLDAEAAMNSLTSPYNNTSNPQTIFVNITNTDTGCAIATLTFNIEVQEAAQANPDGVAIVYELCDDNMEFDGDTSNDSVAFDLESQNPDILDGQDTANYMVTYYDNQADADAATNPLPLLYENTSNPQVIYVRVDNNTMVDDGTGTGTMIDSSTCYETTTITLQVNPMPAFTLEASYLLCINTNGSEVINTPTVNTGLSDTLYTFEWSLDGTVLPGETASAIDPTIGGTYSVVATDIATGCASIPVSTLVEISEPPVLTYDLNTLAFADEHDVTVTASGTAGSIAVYEFSLDGGSWELGTLDTATGNYSYTFTNVAAGIRVVTVRDVNGCGEESIDVPIMDYPVYFTPNGDNIHETWNIYGIEEQADAKIYIFDRFGKLLKQLSPTGDGWDGTYNGNPMPTSDYWFTVEYTEPGTDIKKNFRAHFTLKR